MIKIVCMHFYPSVSPSRLGMRGTNLFLFTQCRAFAKAQDTLRTLLQTAGEIAEERSHLRYVNPTRPMQSTPGDADASQITDACNSQPPETTVKTYIRGLQEYNDIKDIGQQLIGLIAENRGVPIHSLYEDGEFGVSYPP